MVKYRYGPVVKRLRRNPLKVESRVRFPAGSPVEATHETRVFLIDRYTIGVRIDARPLFKKYAYLLPATHRALEDMPKKRKRNKKRKKK